MSIVAPPTSLLPVTTNVLLAALVIRLSQHEAEVVRLCVKIAVGVPARVDMQGSTTFLPHPPNFDTSPPAGQPGALVLVSFPHRAPSSFAFVHHSPSVVLVAPVFVAVRALFHACVLLQLWGLSLFELMWLSLLVLSLLLLFWPRASGTIIVWLFQLGAMLTANTWLF